MGAQYMLRVGQKELKTHPGWTQDGTGWSHHDPEWAAGEFGVARLALLPRQVVAQDGPRVTQSGPQVRLAPG